MAAKCSDNSKNVCVICLEPLLCAKDGDDDDNDKMLDMGVSSCGHPAHHSCFQQWATFQKGDENKERRIPCPTCQRDTTSFVKVYLRDENKDSIEGEDDDDEEEEDCNESIASSSSTANGLVILASTASHLGSGSADPPGRKPSSQSLTATNNNIVATRSNNNSNKKKKSQKEVIHKKTQWYKKKWMAKQDEVKILKLEAQNRKKCHHDDLVTLEQCRLMNYRLANLLEQTTKAARFRRNAVGVVCFAVGWLLNRKFMSCG